MLQRPTAQHNKMTHSIIKWQIISVPNKYAISSSLSSYNSERDNSYPYLILAFVTIDKNALLQLLSKIVVC